jgi:DNA-binding HxlR family transcriptional regulator
MDNPSKRRGTVVQVETEPVQLVQAKNTVDRRDFPSSIAAETLSAQSLSVGTVSPADCQPFQYALAMSLVLRNPMTLIDDPSAHFKLPPKFEGSPHHIELETTVAQLTQAMWAINARWKLPVLILLYADPQMRTAQLRRNMPGITGRTLVELLRELERDHLLERIEFTTGRPRIEYRLSQMAQRLLPVLIAAKAFSASRPPRR